MENSKIFLYIESDRTTEGQMEKRKKKNDTLLLVACINCNTKTERWMRESETQREKTETYTEKRELRLIPCIIPVTIGRVLFRGRHNPISTR